VTVNVVIDDVSVVELPVVVDSSVVDIGVVELLSVVLVPVTVDTSVELVTVEVVEKVAMLVLLIVAEVFPSTAPCTQFRPVKDDARGISLPYTWKPPSAVVVVQSPAESLDVSSASKCRPAREFAVQAASEYSMR
jgi:hypothetical protein